MQLRLVCLVGGGCFGMATALAGSLAVGSGSQPLSVSVHRSCRDGGRRAPCNNMLAIPGLKSWTVVKSPSPRYKNCVISSSQCESHVCEPCLLVLNALGDDAKYVFILENYHRMNPLFMAPIVRENIFIYSTSTYA